MEIAFFLRRRVRALHRVAEIHHALPGKAGFRRGPRSPAHPTPPRPREARRGSVPGACQEDAFRKTSYPAISLSQKEFPHRDHRNIAGEFRFIIPSNDNPVLHLQGLSGVAQRGAHPFEGILAPQMPSANQDGQHWRPSIAKDGQHWRPSFLGTAGKPCGPCLSCGAWRLPSFAGCVSVMVG